MRVLLIAPRMDDLPSVDSEVGAIVNSGLKPKLLNGHVTRQRVVEAVSTADYDLLWLATHGTELGIQLSDGILDRTSLISYVRANGIRYVVLNTCDSFRVGNAIAQGAGADVIATIGETGDNRAYETGALMAARLADGDTFRLAYEKSKPGENEDYTYFSGIFNAPQRKGFDVNDVQAQLLAQIQSEVKRMTSLIDGNPDYGIVGIRKDLALVLQMTQTAQNERDALRSEVRALSEKLEQERREREALRALLEKERHERQQMHGEMVLLAEALNQVGARVKSDQPWYREWSGPIISFLFLVAFVLVMIYGGG